MIIFDNEIEVSSSGWIVTAGKQKAVMAGIVIVLIFPTSC